MGLVQILVIWGLATASPFSFSQEEITKGNQRNPYQPPAWIARMATQPKQYIPQLDSFIVGSDNSHSPRYAVPSGSSGKYACKPQMDGKGGIQWQFCDM